MSYDDANPALTVSLAGKALTIDNMATDQKAAAYRTGEIDPAIQKIPADITRNIKKDPDTYLPKLVNFLKKGSDNEYHTTKRIHDWITKTIAYDSDWFLGLGEGSQEVNDVVSTCRTTCGGFATLFKEMCDLAGLEAVYIFGRSRTYIKVSGEWGNHAWNAVNINNKWYIVDTTHSNRMSYRDKIFSELRKYNDTELFIRPDAKLLVNMPVNDEYQFLDKPISIETFYTQPRYLMNYYQYKDINFITDPNELEIIKEELDGGVFIHISQGFTLSNQPEEFILSCPEEYMVRCSLYDDDESYTTNYSYVSRNGNKRKVHFSAPGKGKYWLTISIRTPDKSQHSIYKLRIIGTDKNGGPLLPDEDKLTLLDTEYYPYFSLSDITYPTTDLPYYSVTIDYKDPLEFYAAPYKNGKDRVDNYVFYSHLTKNRIRYRIQTPGKNHLIKISARNKGDTSYQYPAIKIWTSDKFATKSPAQPTKDLMVKKSFHEKGYALTDPNTPITEIDGIYTVNLTTPANDIFSALLKSKDNKNMNDNACYQITNNNATVSFSSPGKGEWEARLYSVTNDNKWSIIASFILPKNAQKGPKLPLHMQIAESIPFKKNNFYYITDPVIEETTPGLYHIAISSPDSLQMSAGIKDQNNKNVNSNFAVHTADAGIYDFYFSAPSPGRYIGKIYQYDGQSKWTTVCQMGLDYGKTGPNLPAANNLYLQKTFHKYKLKLLNSSFKEGSCRIEIKCPDNVIVKGIIKDKNKKALYKQYTNERQGNTHIIEFAATNDEYHPGWIWVKYDDEFPDKSESYFARYAARFAVQK